MHLTEHVAEKYPTQWLVPKPWPRGYKTLFILNTFEHDLKTSESLKAKKKHLYFSDFCCYEQLKCHAQLR